MTRRNFVSTVFGFVAGFFGIGLASTKANESVQKATADVSDDIRVLIKNEDGKVIAESRSIGYTESRPIYHVRDLHGNFVESSPAKTVDICGETGQITHMHEMIDVTKKYTIEIHTTAATVLSGTKENLLFGNPQKVVTILPGAVFDPIITRDLGVPSPFVCKDIFPADIKYIAY